MGRWVRCYLVTSLVIPWPEVSVHGTIGEIIGKRCICTRGFD
jgi:hypothetical protein